ncbi:hypothetical protein ACFV1N_25365 [Streptosporangium canum]|uniref:hypothetical protein n=1 Tax=Streptosporangium canum TaxID=324952 RepID=UPI00367D16C0
MLDVLDVIAALLSEPGPKTLSAQLRRQRHISGAAWLVHHVVQAPDRPILSILEESP